MDGLTVSYCSSPLVTVRIVSCNPAELKDPAGFSKTLAKLAKAEGGIDAYREEGGYKKDLNSMLNDILRKIKAKRK